MTGIFHVILQCRHSNRVVGVPWRNIVPLAFCLPRKLLVELASPTLGSKMLCDVEKAVLIAMNVGFSYLQCEISCITGAQTSRQHGSCWRALNGKKLENAKYCKYLIYFYLNISVTRAPKSL